MRDYVKEGWDNIKNELNSIKEYYSKKETRRILLLDDYYKKFYGRAKNRTMIKEHPVLYNSIYKHTNILEDSFKNQKSYKGMYSFSKRIDFIVYKNYDINSLKCKCGLKYTWNTYCRKCPEYHDVNTGKIMSSESKKKCRKSALKYLEKLNGQLCPRYNKDSIKLIESYGNDNNLNFQHAENGGEFHIKELGYWVDGYDKEKNVVIEIDENHHFDKNGNLKEKDIIRQQEIEEFLKCEFIRIKI